MRSHGEFFRFVEVRHLNRQEGEKRYVWCFGDVYVQSAGDATVGEFSENLYLLLDSEAHSPTYA